MSFGRRYIQQSNQHFQVDARDPQSFHRLLQETIIDSDRGLNGIILIGLASSIEVEPTLEQLQNAQEKTCGSILHLVQAILKIKTAPPPFWWVTRGTQSVGGEAVFLPPICSALGHGTNTGP